MNKDELEEKLESLKGRLKDAAEGLAGKQKRSARDPEHPGGLGKSVEEAGGGDEVDASTRSAPRDVEEADDE